MAMMPQKLYHLKKTSHVLESAVPEQPLVLLEPVRNEHVLERLALLSDLQIAVSLAALHLVVVLDEEPVEGGVLAEHFLDQDQAAVVIEAACPGSRSALRG